MNDKSMPDLAVIEERVRRNLGRVMLAARWIMAPIYIGLLVALVLIVVKFAQELVQAIPGYLTMATNDAIFLALMLIDLTLVANLIIIVIFAGWEHYIGRLRAAQSDDGTESFSGLDFSGVKLRLIGSIAVIGAILILETFVHIDQVKLVSAAMQLAILLGIGVVGVLLALMDRLHDGHEGK